MDTKLTQSQLTKLTKKDIVIIYISLQQLAESLTAQYNMQEKQLSEVNHKMDLLIEQTAIGRQKRFDPFLEKIDWEGRPVILFNEAEAIIADKYVIEHTLSED